MTLPDQTVLAIAMNAFALLEEAELLFEQKRYPRAAALAVFAVEEANKCWMVKWDPDWKNNFYNHSQKLAESAPFRRSEAEGTVAISTGGDTGSLRDIHRAAQNDPDLEAWKHKAVRFQDIKENALYVNASPTGELTNDPLKAIGRDKAVECLTFTRTEVERLKIIEAVKSDIKR